jgi:dolichol-phosphate mannosyltransferase
LKSGVQVSVVVPCYNEEDVLESLLERTDAACRKVVQSYEIVVVNDGSTDATWTILCEARKRYPRLLLVNLARNHGHQLALTAGLKECRGERILTMDGDLQDPPELLPEMMSLMDGGADVVYGKRRSREGESWQKKLTARLFYRCLRFLSETELPADVGDFRLMTRQVLDVFLQMPERNRYVRGMISWLGFRQVPLKYDRDPRFAGQTKYRWGTMVRLSFDAITSFSTRPLSLTAFLAFLFSFIGISLLVFAIASWMFLDAVPGWASLLAALSVISSLQFLILSIFGAYLGRIYSQCQQRPLTIVRTVIQPADFHEQDR